jgi:hypothetical protein
VDNPGVFDLQCWLDSREKEEDHPELGRIQLLHKSGEVIMLDSSESLELKVMQCLGCSVLSQHTAMGSLGGSKKMTFWVLPWLAIQVCLCKKDKFNYSRGSTKFLC